MTDVLPGPLYSQWKQMSEAGLGLNSLPNVKQRDLLLEMESKLPCPTHISASYTDCLIHMIAVHVLTV